MMGIWKGSLGALMMTVLVLVVISPTTAGEEHQPAEVHQGPPSLQQRVVRGTGEKKLKKKKKTGRGSEKKKLEKKLRKSKKQDTKEKGRKTRGKKRNKDKKLNKKK